MVGTVDLRAAHGPTLDEAPWLSAYLQQVIGQPFVFFRESYGDELTMHLGTPVTVQPPNPKLKARTESSYVLTFRGSAWWIASGPETASLTLAGPSLTPDGAGGRLIPLKDLEKSPPITPGALVQLAEASLTPAGFGVLLWFSDGSRLALLPDPAPESAEDEELPPLADWELFTPHGMYLKVGPGSKWAYLPSRTEKSTPANGDKALPFPV